MSWYGTEREALDIATILASTPLHTTVVNPAEHQKEPTMAKFLLMVEQADALAYRTFDDDFIGAGVAQEVLAAALHGKQIFRIMDLTRDKGPILFEQRGLRAAFGPRVLTIIETKGRIKRGMM
jgi:hypothetical protein